MFHRVRQFRAKISHAIERRFDQNRYPKLGKADISNLLGQTNGYTSYLEVASRNTGHEFASVSDEIFTNKQRLLYDIPENYSDNLPINYASDDLTGESCFEEIIESSQTFDVVFVDPYHSYESSIHNLESGFKLLNTDGVMVVHDCNPPSEEVASTTQRGRYWCGLTYLAFLHFVQQHQEAEYCVVNTDWGVGLVFKKGSDRPERFGSIPKRPTMDCSTVRDWKAFNAHRKRLLRLISVNKFMKTFVRK